MLRLSARRSLALSVPKANAEQTRQRLLDDGVLDTGLYIRRDERFVFFPVRQKPSPLPPGAQFSRLLFKPLRPPKGSLKEQLAQRGFKANELERVVSSFDVLGEVALIEIPPELQAKEKRIAEILLQTHPRLRLVVKKTARQGEYRVQQLTSLAGHGSTETLVTENGVRLRLDPAKVYYSVRLSTERARIASLVKPGERVLVPFAGVGPFPLTIARELEKKKRAAQIIGVELNPAAVAYFQQNIALNHTEKLVRVIEGDANHVLPTQFKAWADRIVMPLPHSAHEFLDAALAAAAEGCVIHFYGFVEKGKNALQPYAPLEKIVQQACARNHKTCRILLRKIVRPYAPHTDQAVLDVRVTSRAA